MAVIEASLGQESREKYLTYALSVVSGRAIPDVRDGLKPVQRRILYAMHNNLRLSPTGGHRKSATVVGEVLGRYHPHGDLACYEAMVRMAQDFSLRYPLVDGEGNFGSLDGDNAAAYRYTEARLSPMALEVIGEIDQETVAFRENFDSTTVEPTVFPSRLPNLLINGASGIAVGLATNIPPHNLRDVAKAILELISDPEISTPRLVSIVKAPDFPTKCSVLNTKKELDEIYRTGRGNIRMRADWEVEEGNRGKRFVIVSSIPYAVDKSQLVEKIANLIIDRKVPQLVDVRDESTEDIRVVLELASGADPEVAMAYLFKHTPLESNFPVNLTALVPVEGSIATKPELLSLKQCLQHFLDFRREVVEKKLRFEAKKLLERIHILEGLVIVFNNLDEVLKIVRKSEGRSDAANKLIAKLDLSEIQAYAVVDMRIYQISRTSIDEVRAELKVKSDRVKDIEGILKSKKAIDKIVEKELNEVAEKFGDNRYSKLIKDDIELDFKEEDYVVQDNVFAIVTRDGWIKRIRQNNELETTRIREGDKILRAHPLTTLDAVVFITNLGNVYSLKVSVFPSSSGYGDPIQKTLKFKDGEAIVESFGLRLSEPKIAEDATFQKDYEYVVQNGTDVLLVTKAGKGCIIKLEGLEAIKRSGKRVMKVREDDLLASVAIFTNATRVLLVSKKGAALLIKSDEIPVRAGASVGVSLIGIKEDDSLLSVFGFKGSATFLVETDGGTKKELKSSEIDEGKRAQRGQKLIARGSIASIVKL